MNPDLWEASVNKALTRHDATLYQLSERASRAEQRLEDARK
jgi:hypothetical protein